MKRTTLLVLLLSLISTEARADGGVEARDAQFEAGLVGGVRGWQTPYRKSSAQFAYGLTAGVMPRPWLQLIAIMDHARRTSTPDDLRVTNTETWLTLGPRLSLWFEFVRVFAELGPAGVLRTVSYRDAEVPRPARFSTGLATGAGFTIAIAHRLGVTMRGNWRRRNDQSHLLGTLEVSWLFQPSPR